MPTPIQRINVVIFKAVFIYCLSAIFISCSSKNDYLKIGAILPLTGNSASWGEQGKYGIELAVEDINSKGGINGKLVNVIYEDSKAIPKDAVSAIQKLINADKVPAVIGDIVSATTLAMAPIVEKGKVVLIGISCSAPAISQAGQYVYRVWPSDLLEGSTFAKYVSSKGYKNICVLHMKNDYGSGLAKVFEETFIEKGGNVPLVQGYSQDEIDFKPYLRKIQSKNCDGIYIMGYYQDAALILKQAREIGLKTQFFGATAVENSKLIEVAGDGANGLIYPTITDFDIKNPSPIAKDFISRFAKRFGVEPDWASSHAYDATLVICETMKRGSLSGSDIKATIDSVKIFNGVTGTITFDSNGDVVNKPVTIKIVKDGKFQILE